MVAFHFPPMTGSSGVQRTLRFVQHLPALDWQPLVLSAGRRAYEQSGDDLLNEVPAGTVVQRAFALDTARHLTVRGRYMGWMARPDRWVSWRFAALRDGLRMVRRWQPDVIWSTYPIATAHLIAAALHRRTGIPWVADFRDPMAQDGYPADPLTWRSYQRIEEQTLLHARHSVFTTPGAAALYRHRYPAAASRVEVVENGYDEESFAGLLSAGGGGAPAPALRRLTLLHSGIVYPSERDPTQLFVALARLRAAGVLQPGEWVIRFRAPVHEELLRQLAGAHGVLDSIELCPPIGYRDALAEMAAADALLVMQAANCNAQIPAKVYEYLRAGRPIVALTDPLGDTAQVMVGAGLDAVAPLDSADAIAALLPGFLAAVRARQAPLPKPEAVRRASRRVRSSVLAQLLDSAAGAASLQ